MYALCFMSVKLNLYLILLIIGLPFPPPSMEEGKSVNHHAYLSLKTAFAACHIAVGQNRND